MTLEKKLHIALAGQANVGKSVIFNHLTGLHQHVGNWPGKTIEKAEGILNYGGRTFHVLDLPGIYSLSTYSIEEKVSREYIVEQKPDFIINVADSTRLEKNLIFTLQLLELERPLVLDLNMMDLAKEKGIKIDIPKLQDILGIPVVPTVGSRRKSLTKLLDAGISLVKGQFSPWIPAYGREVENRIEKIVQRLKDLNLVYPRRWLAIKFLEKDREVERILRSKVPEACEGFQKIRSELEDIYGHDSSVVISSERCTLVSQIVDQVMELKEPQPLSFRERIDHLASHKIWGYPLMVAVLGTIFAGIFGFGNWLSQGLQGLFSGLMAYFYRFFGSSVVSLLAGAGLESILALVNIALPYIIPFYLFLFLLEDSGYLGRVAFLLDNLMHRIGVHGKACIPLMVGLGCNVPGCLACRIMETKRERFVTGLLTTLVPCSAVTVIILGLVGKFVGINWVIGLYLFSLLVIVLVGKTASWLLPGEPSELIMEMPDLRSPNLKTVFLQAWMRVKEFILFASPLIILSGMVIEGFRQLGFLGLISDFLSPITTGWLGLPEVCGVLFILGILRKELILLMLATLLGTANFIEVLSPLQMVVLSLVSMFYIPCVSTIATLGKEFGWKKALGITLFEIALALGVGGVAARLIPLLINRV